LAYRQVFAFYLNVEFYVFAFAGFFPRVFTMFHYFASNIFLMLFAFKVDAQTNVWFWGEIIESKNLYLK
jgi:hypothetical protein